MTLAYCGRLGIAVGEVGQGIQEAEGWKTLYLHETLVDTDAIYNDASGTYTIPATGIYYVNWQARGGTGPNTRILKNGTEVLAEGHNPNSTGSDKSNATAVFFGCLEAGSILKLQASANSILSTQLDGYAALLRVPTPDYSIAQGVPVGAPAEYDVMMPWDDICNQPNWLDPGQPTRATVTESGYYFITVKGQMARNTYLASINRRLQLYKNGVYQHIETATPGSANNANMPLTTVLYLNAGDYLEVYNDVKDTATHESSNTEEWQMFRIPAPVHGAHTYKALRPVSTSFVNVPMDSALFDTEGYWSSGAPTRLTVPAGLGGTYLVWAQYTQNANRAINFNIVASSLNQSQFGATGIDYTSFHSWAASTSFAIWNLAAGDFVTFGVQNGDGTGDTSGGFHAIDLHFGLIRLDGWTYKKVSRCPCPTPWLPQIYRRKGGAR